MVVLGIDPGYAIVGYGAVEFVRGHTHALGYGAITTKAGVPLPDRLSEIYRDMTELLQKLRPDAIAIEELFFNTNVTTGIAVAQARGVIVLACAQSGVPVFQYTPLQVKMAVVGYGRAEKRQVMEMTRIMLGLDKVPRPDDAADALAVALCHGHTSQSLTSDGRQ